jgi:hypothetical protein
MADKCYSLPPYPVLTFSRPVLRVSTPALTPSSPVLDPCAVEVADQEETLACQRMSAKIA